MCSASDKTLFLLSTDFPDLTEARHAHVPHRCVAKSVKSVKSVVKQKIVVASTRIKAYFKRTTDGPDAPDKASAHPDP